MHESFLNHGKLRYLWIALVLSLASLAMYIWHDPIVKPNGGTWLGYTLGTIGAVLIFWLTSLGIRKRQYRSNLGSMRGWLSAHVYLGTSLIFVATLHCGFQFGWNIHTLAYTLMIFVIVSGFFGVFAYLRYPNLMTRNRDSASRDAMVQEIEEIDQNALSLADKVDPKIHSVVLRSIERTKPRGGALALLRGATEADEVLLQLRAFKVTGEVDTANANPPPKKDMATMVAMVDFLSSAKTDTQSKVLRELIDQFTRKKNLMQRVARDRRFQAMMDVWLFVHVPATFALLAALVAHIIAVFFYW